MPKVTYKKSKEKYELKYSNFCNIKLAVNCDSKYLVALGLG